jgi:hypothetical protein
MCLQVLQDLMLLVLMPVVVVLLMSVVLVQTSVEQKCVVLLQMFAVQKSVVQKCAALLQKLEQVVQYWPQLEMIVQTVLFLYTQFLLQCLTPLAMWKLH